MSAETVTFYDLLRKKTNQKLESEFSYSPNTWRTRYLLNIRNIPYKTIYLDYPDVTPTIGPLGVKAAGNSTDPPFYSTPTIVDPKGFQAVTDSIGIYEYITKTYPPSEYPEVAPGTAEQLSIAMDFRGGIMGAIYMSCMVPATYPFLTERGQAHYRNSRQEHWFKRPFDDILATSDSEKSAKWDEAFACMAKAGARFDAIAPKSSFLGGETPIWPDVIMAAQLKAMQNVFGADSKEWANVEKADGGRWKRFLDAFKKYEGTQPLQI